MYTGADTKGISPPAPKVNAGIGPFFKLQRQVLTLCDLMTEVCNSLVGIFNNLEYILEEIKSKKNQAYGIQLVSPSGLRSPFINNMISTIHQMPRPPKVKSLPTAVPV